MTVFGCLCLAEFRFPDGLNEWVEMGRWMARLLGSGVM